MTAHCGHMHTKSADPSTGISWTISGSQMEFGSDLQSYLPAEYLFSVIAGQYKVEKGVILHYIFSLQFSFKSRIKLPFLL